MYATHRRRHLIFSGGVQSRKVPTTTLFFYENISPGGGNFHIYWYGTCHFWGAFFRAGNKFWGIIFDKIIGGHKFWGIIFSITNYGPIIRFYFQHELNFRVYTLYGM